MSEIQADSGDYGASYEDGFDAARRVNEDVHEMMRGGRALSEMTFTSNEEAEAAAMAFLTGCANKQEANRAMFDYQLYATGDTVEVTNIGNKTIANGALTIEFHPTESYIPLNNPFESKTFSYTSFNVGVMQEGEEKYKLDPYMYGRDTQIHTIGVQNAHGISMASVVVAPMVRVPCSDASIEVGVVVLQAAEERSRAIQELDGLPGEDGQRAREIIQQLYEIVQSEKQESFIDIEPAILHELGRIGATYALQDYKKSDTLNTAVKATLGDGRFIKIAGTSYTNTPEGVVVPEMVEEFGGGVIDIIPDIPQSNGETPHGTTLVIERRVNGGNTIHYAAMTDITKLSL